MPKLTRKTRELAQNDLLAGLPVESVCAKYGITPDAIRKWNLQPPVTDTSAIDPASAALAAAGAREDNPAEAPSAVPPPAVPSVELSQSDIERLLIQVPRLVMRAACFGSAVAFKLPMDQKSAADVIGKLAELKKEEEEILAILSPFVVQYAGAACAYAGPIALVGYFGTIAVGSVARLLTVRAYAREYWAAVHAAQTGTTGSVPGQAGNGKDNPDAQAPRPAGAGSAVPGH